MSVHAKYNKNSPDTNYYQRKTTNIELTEEELKNILNITDDKIIEAKSNLN